MTLTEARNLLDILIDKANNPYFINNEKDEFLSLAITEFINKYYSVNDLSEQARAALKGVTVVTQQTSTSSVLLLPGDFMYLLSLGIQYNYPTQSYGAARLKKYTLAKQVSPAQFRFQTDPFNKPTKENPLFTYVSGSSQGITIHILPDIDLQKKYVYYIKRPDIADVFTAFNPEIEESYQHEIVQIAARKMAANIESSNYEVQSQEAE
jgi:hypothetical protein